MKGWAKLLVLKMGMSCLLTVLRSAQPSIRTLGGGFAEASGVVSGLGRMSQKTP